MINTNVVPILLVDDQRNNLITMSALLEHIDDLEIVHANSGEQALQLLLKREFGLVLMDVQMPGMDGFEAATLMRTNPKTRQVPIIFVTAELGNAEFEFRGYESGAVDYLVKPISPVMLQAKVQVFVSLYRQRVSLAEHERYMQHVEFLVAERSGRRMHQDHLLRVLLVDDSAANLVALEALLSDMPDMQVVKASSGQEALRAVLQDDFAAILLDVQMPGMDGFETAELIRANPKTRSIPIIFVTAGMKDWDALTRGYQQGAVDYLIKPLEPSIVKSKVRVFCELYQQRLTLEKHSTYLEVLIAERTNALETTAAQLNESREGYRRLAEKLELATRAAHLGVWDWNVVADTLVWDTRMLELYEVEPQQFGGWYQAWLERVHPDDRVRCEAAIQSALTGERAYDIEFRICLPDGRVRDLKADGLVVFDAKGQALRMTGINYDITERKRVEDEVRRHRDHLLELVEERTASLNAIVEHAADGIVTIDQYGAIQSFNAAAEHMFGYPASVVLGSNISCLMPEPQQREHNDHLARYRDSGQAHIIGVGRELLGRRQDGTVFPLYLAVSEITVGGHKRFTGILRDISAQKALEASLIAAREVAEAANQAKSNFLASMSHELRTPLNAILGFSQILCNESNITAAQRKTLDLINRSGENLLNLINDVLDMSKIEAGGLSLNNSHFDLAAMASDVVELMRARAQVKHLQLRLEQSIPFVPVICADEAKLRQCLINLIGNAIKFTYQGEIVLRLQIQPSLDVDAGRDAIATPLTLHLEVQDSGVGISPEDQQCVFQPFVQVGPQNTQKGTGLGLSITDKLVQCMQGQLQLQSALGQGSIFRISIPVTHVQEMVDSLPAHRSQPAKVCRVAPGQPDYRILIVEDQMENWLLLQQLLEGVGLSVRVVENGSLAVAEFSLWQPHFIWMDIRMPVMDGIEATRIIRSLDGGRQVKIAAVSASAMADESAAIMAAGMDDFVRKPYRPDEIYSCMARQLGVQFIYATVAPETPASLAAETSLQPSDFCDVPAEIRARLRLAALELDPDKLAASLVLLAPLHPELAASIERITQAFRYDELLQLLSETTPSDAAACSKSP